MRFHAFATAVAMCCLSKADAWWDDIADAFETIGDAFGSAVSASWSALDDIGVDDLVDDIRSGDIVGDLADTLQVAEIGNFVADHVGGFAALAVSEIVSVAEDLHRVTMIVAKELEKVGQMVVDVINQILAFLGCFFDRLMSGENPVLCLCGLDDLADTFDNFDPVVTYLNEKLEAIQDFPSPDKIVEIIADHVFPDDGECAGDSVVTIPFPDELNQVFEAFNKIPCVPDLPTVPDFSICKPDVEVLLQEIMEPIQEYKNLLLGIVTGESATEFYDVLKKAVKNAGAAQQVCFGLQLRAQNPKVKKFDLQVQVTLCMDLYGVKPSFFQISLVPVILPMTLFRKPLNFDFIVNLQKSMKTVERVEANMWTGMHMSMNAEVDQMAAISFGSLLELSNNKQNNPEFDCDLEIHVNLIPNLQKVVAVHQKATNWYKSSGAASRRRLLRVGERELLGFKLPCLDFEFPGLLMRPMEFTFNFPMSFLKLPLTINTVTSSFPPQMPGEPAPVVRATETTPDLPIVLKTRHTESKCLDVNKVRSSPDNDHFEYGNVKYEVCQGHSQQLWVFHPSLQSLKSVDNQLCLTAVSGHPHIRTEECTGSKYQRWSLQAGKIKNLGSTQCLQPGGGQGSCDTAETHVWNTAGFLLQDSNQHCVTTVEVHVIFATIYPNFARPCKSHNADTLFILYSNGQLVRMQDRTCLSIVGDEAHQRDCEGAPTQRFSRSPTGQIKSMSNPAKCLLSHPDGKYRFVECSPAPEQKFNFQLETSDLAAGSYRVAGNVVYKASGGRICSLQDESSLQLFHMPISFIEVGHLPSMMIYDGHCREPDVAKGTFPRAADGAIYKMVETNVACHIPSMEVWDMHYPATVTQYPRLPNSVVVTHTCGEPILAAGNWRFAHTTKEVIMTNGNGHFCRLQDEVSLDIFHIPRGSWKDIGWKPAPMIDDGICQEPWADMGTYPRDGAGVIYKVTSHSEVCAMPNMEVWGMYRAQVSIQLPRLRNIFRVSGFCPEPVLPSGDYRWDNTGQVIRTAGNGHFCVVQDEYGLALLGIAHGAWTGVSRQPNTMVSDGVCFEHAPPIGAYPRIHGVIHRITGTNFACRMPNEVIWDMYWYTGNFYDVPRLPNQVVVSGDCPIPVLAAGWWRFVNSGIIGYSDGQGNFCKLSSMHHYFVRGAPWYKNIAFWPHTVRDVGFCHW